MSDESMNDENMSDEVLDTEMGWGDWRGNWIHGKGFGLGMGQTCVIPF